MAGDEGWRWQACTPASSATEAKRRQAQTAKALGIPVEKKMDLGNGVILELVLIPVGRSRSSVYRRCMGFVVRGQHGMLGLDHLKN